MEKKIYNAPLVEVASIESEMVFAQSLNNTETVSLGGSSDGWGDWIEE